MTPLQQELARSLWRAAASAGCRRVVYHTEYLGYLPFGQYHWVTVSGRDVSLTCPEGYGWRDFESLADAGVLTRASQWVNPLDDSERVSQYDVVTPDTASDGGSL